jgi:predicted GIY-YIG superfamily endonuclease
MTGPLRERLGESFLRSLPPKPGVYLMLGDDDELLYVGKAKNLRTRIRSYTRLTKDDDPRRISMIAKVRAVRWEEAANDAAAIERETELLRVLRPPFNHSHAARSKYLGIAVVDNGPMLHLRIASEGALPDETLYGCFPFEASTPDAFGALVRVLSVAASTGGPSRASSTKARAAGVDVRTADDVKPLVARFLCGRSPRLVDALDERVVASDADVLVLRAVSRDLAVLRTFYAAGPRTVRRLQLASGSPTRGVSADELTDLMAAALRSHFGVRVDDRRLGVKDLIVRLKADGLGFDAIAARLNRDGIPRVRGAGRWAAHEVAEVIGEQIDLDLAAAATRLRGRTLVGDDGRQEAGT